jgi:hypothetical protein
MRKFTLFFSMFFLSVLALNAQTLETKFTKFEIQDQVSSTINDDNTIDVLVPSDADLTALVAVFNVPTGADVKIDAVEQVSSTTVNDFSSPVTYTVTNGEVGQNWVVTVTKQPAGVKENAQLQADVYPNPANDMLTIDGVDNATVTVVNIIGRQIERIQINDVTRTISTLAYPNGTYLVIIESNGKRAVKKVSVIH